MYPLLTLGGTALVLALILTPLMRDLFLRWKIVDLPDEKRKRHKKPVPRVGGIAIFCSYLFSLMMLLFLAPGGAPVPWESLAVLVQLLPAGIVVFATGLLDDLIQLKPWQKLAGQFAGAGLACAMGVRITLLAGHPAQEWWSIPLTIVWLLGCMNAFNLIDGVDGLAAGVGLFATSTTLLAALLQGNLALAFATVPLAGCLLGFLRYNFNPASIFLGDCGSLVIGFLLGSFAVIWSQKSATLLGMTAPMMALALPLLDVALSISRRFLRNAPIFEADSGHIHHRLLDRGLGPRAVALTLYGVSGTAAVLSLMQGVLYKEMGGLIIVLFCAVAGVFIAQLNYVEFGVARQVVKQGTFRRILQEEILLRGLKDSLQSAATLDECWPLVTQACADLGFRTVELRVKNRIFEPEQSEQERASWSVQIALHGFGHIRLDRTSSSHSLLLMRLVEFLQAHLEERYRSESAALDTNGYAEIVSPGGALLKWPVRSRVLPLGSKKSPETAIKSSNVVQTG